jgi:ABC-type multidrug transport system fused ATPase/permease subunit
MIMFDSVDIRKIGLRALREAIGYVPQEPAMIIGTIKENLLYGNRDATDAQIADALRRANATFVLDFESGLDSFIGSGAVVNLSGG